MIRVLSGHNALMYHRSKVDSENNSPLCRFCLEHETETFIHLITSCPRFANDRRQLFLDQPITDSGDWDVNNILTFTTIPDISSALAGYFDDVHYTESLATTQEHDRPEPSTQNRAPRLTQTSILSYMS